MKRRSLLVAVPGLVVAGLAASLAGCLDRVRAASTSEHTLPHDGLDRSYLLTRASEEEPLPTIVVLHGGGGSAKQMRRYAGFDDVAGARGFNVVYPDGVDSHWNDGRETEVSTAHREGVDDVGFLDALVTELVESGVALDGEVFVTGISNGGMMTVRAACELSSRLRGAAVVAGNQPASMACLPENPLAISFLHGTADPLVPYEGGVVAEKRDGSGRGTVESAEDSVATWVQHNGCSVEPAVRWIDDVEDDETRAEVREYSGGAAPVQHVIVHGGGHGWPGEETPLIEPIIGPPTKEVDGTEWIVAFFESLSG